MVELKQINKEFGNKVIFVDLNLFIRRGHTFGLIGKNGSGKTTLLKIICGYERVTSGVVEIFNGVRINPKLGVSIYESDQLINEIDGFTYLNFIGRIHKMSRFEIEKAILELSEYFEFNDALYKPIALYSTGTRKKISICAAVIHTPHLLLLDEPFENLDLNICQKLIAFLQTFQNPERTIIITSNQIDFLIELSSIIGVLTEGSIKEFKNNHNGIDPDLRTKILTMVK